MLTHHSYQERRATLTRDISEAQGQVDAALAETEGRTDARVHAQKHALASLVQARDDLDAAWRASQGRIAEKARGEETQARRAAMTSVKKALTDVTSAAAELQATAARYRELVAACRASEATVRRSLMKMVVRDRRGRDAVEALPTLMVDDELPELLAGRLDLAALVSMRAHSAGEMAQRILFPESTPSLAVVADEVTT